FVLRTALLASVDSDHDDAPVAQLLPDLFLQMRSLRIARPSPGGEEAEQDQLPPIGGQRLFLPGEAREAERGRRPSLQCQAARLRLQVRGDGSEGGSIGARRIVPAKPGDR